MSPAEFAVMKLLWTLGRGSVAEVRAAHSEAHGSELAYTTVMTLLGRLASKGALKVDKKKQPFVYRPAFRRESVLRARLRSFIDTVFDGQADSLVLSLVENESLSAEELKRIQEAIDSTAEDDER
jgi:predicted transcriptional regulator